MFETEDDRRRHVRIPLVSRVQFLVDGKGPEEGEVSDISLGGAAVQSDMRPPIGETVTAYVENIARLEGRVVRYVRNGFAIQFEMGARKRDRLKAAITRFLQPGAGAAGPEKRQFVRADALDHAAFLETADGERSSCKVQEFSIVGASVETEARFPVGAAVKLGSKAARVVRHTPYGLALEFTDYWNAISRN